MQQPANVALSIRNPNIAKLEVVVSSLEDYGVNAKLEGKLSAVGFALGGSVSAFKKTEHIYDVVFFTSSDYEGIRRNLQTSR